MTDTQQPDISKDVNRGLAWVGLASSSVGVLDFVAQVVILALWISPELYGVAALAITLFPILDKATDLGLSAAVIQRDDHTPEKISTVFWLNVAMSVSIFLLIWLAIGPGLSRLHGHQIIGEMLTVYGFKLLWQNVYFMPWALMTKDLRFKELSVIRIIANLVEFGTKVAFAATGFGIWCFVFGPLCRVLVTGIGIQLRNPWRPRFVLRLREAMAWFSFGLKASGSKILFYIYTNADYQVVGYYFGAEANGYYRLANELVLEPCRVISDVIISIAFPTFSKLKNYRDKVIEQFIVFTRMNLVVMIAFLGLVFLTADDLIYLFWGSKWMDAVQATRILCFVGVLRALSFVVPPLFDGMGRPQLTLNYTLVATAVIPACFVGAAVWLGPSLGEVSVAVAWAVGYPIAFAVLFAMALNVLDLPLATYLRRTLGIPLWASVAMGLAAGARWLVIDLHPAIRFGVAATVMTSVFFLLLAYREGISPRSVAKAIKG
jgi:O-antigen/teichoic acid export membrane protein